MARTPAYVDAGMTADGSYAVLICQLCDEPIYEGEPGEFSDFIAMTDAHDEHADKVHGEGV